MKIWKEIRGKAAVISDTRGEAVGSLKTRIMWLVIAVTGLFFLMYLAVYWLYMAPSLRRQEQLFARKMMIQVRAALDSSLKDLMALNDDWANWDAMYRAASHWTDSFEREAFPEDIFETLNIDYIGVFAEDHRPLYSKCRVGSDGGSRVESRKLPPEVARVLLRLHEHRLHGIFRTGGRAVFLSAMPIHRSDSGGHPNGFLVMGRQISSDTMSRVSMLVQAPVRMVEREALQAMNADTGDLVVKRDRDRLTVLFPLRDFYNRSIAAIRVDLERAVFQALYHAVAVSMGIHMVSFVILLIGAMVIIQRMALDRIRSMAARMDEARRGKADWPHVQENGRDEITLLQRSFNRLVERLRREQAIRLSLEEQKREIERFVVAGRVTGSILHEINNPIRVIKNCLYAIEQTPDRQEEQLLLLKKEIRQLGMITNQLLDLTRGGELRKGPVDVCALLRELATRLRVAFPEKGWDVVLDVPDSLPAIQGDGPKLRQVFFNLAKNGLEASAFSGNLYLSCTMSDTREWVQVRVADEGPGVPDDMVSLLFDPYVTGKGESGTGLGLYVARDIVRRHGGRLFLDETVTKGACFVVELPVREDGE